MNRKTLPIITLAIAALAGGNAMASDASVAQTRDQIRADLAQAQGTDDTVHGEAGGKLIELFPGSYPRKS